MKIPSEIFQGDSATWDDDSTTDNLGNSIDSTWTLKYAFKQDGVALLTLTASTNGTGWRTTMAKTDSDNFAPGTVYWQAYAEKSSSRVTIGSGRLTINKSLAEASAGAFEGRSQTQQDLEAVQAAMRAMVSGGAVAEYTIQGRSLRKIPMTDLIQLEGLLKARLAREVKAQNIANGLGNPSNLYVRLK